MSRHLGDLDAVLKFDAFDDFRQLVFSLQSPPGFCSRCDKLEHQDLGGFRRQGSLRSRCAMTRRRQHAFDWVCGAQVVPVLRREVGEGEQRFPILGQAGNRLLVLGAVLIGKQVDRVSAVARVGAP